MAKPDRKHEIETRYAELCQRVEEAVGSDAGDDALREAFAELAAMMIAYRHDEGDRKALEAAIARDDGLSTTRLSLAARARALIARQN